MFYRFFPAPFAAKLVIVLLASSAQVVYGLYFGLVEIFWRVTWQWLDIMTVILTLVLMVQNYVGCLERGLAPLFLFLPPLLPKDRGTKGVRFRPSFRRPARA